MINLEMLGGAPDHTLNVRATGTSRAWPALLLEATRRTGLPVTMRQPQLTNDTDHYGFGVRGLPTVHYGVGGSRRHYHRVTDELDGVAFGALAARSRHAAALLEELGNRGERLDCSWVHPPDAGITGVTLTPAEVESLGLGQEETGVKVTAVAAGLPARKAGLQAGDVILRAAGRPLTPGTSGLAVIGRAFRELEVGRVLNLSVVRGGQTLTIGVQRERIP
jgi:hypothetical protein